MEEKKFVLICKALGDDVRMKIVNMLRGGELCANDILIHLNCRQPTLSYHMKLLCKSGIVKARRQGLWVFYSLNSAIAKEAREQLEMACTPLKTNGRGN